MWKRKTRLNTAEEKSKFMQAKVNQSFPVLGFILTGILTKENISRDSRCVILVCRIVGIFLIWKKLLYGALQGVILIRQEMVCFVKSTFTGPSASRGAHRLGVIYPMMGRILGCPRSPLLPPLHPPFFVAFVLLVVLVVRTCGDGEVDKLCSERHAGIYRAKMGSIYFTDWTLPRAYCTRGLKIIPPVTSGPAILKKKKTDKTMNFISYSTMDDFLFKPYPNGIHFPLFLSFILVFPRFPFLSHFLPPFSLALPHVGECNFEEGIASSAFYLGYTFW